MLYLYCNQSKLGLMVSLYWGLLPGVDYKDLMNCRFTYVRKVEKEEDPVIFRLDRFLVSPDWLDLFSDCIQ